MGYLFCRNCRHYYKLAKGESPDDFESCECGSPLEYYKTSSEFIHASHRQVPVSSMTLFEKRRLEDVKIRHMAQKTFKPPNFRNSVFMMFCFALYPVFFGFGYGYGYSSFFILAILAPLLSLLILLTPKKAENVKKIVSICGIYTFVVFILELYWSIKYLPSVVMDYYYSPMAFTFGTPFDPALFAGIILVFTLLFSFKFIAASKNTLRDPFEWNDESSWVYGFLMFQSFLVIIVILIMYFLGVN